MSGHLQESQNRLSLKNIENEERTLKDASRPPLPKLVTRKRKLSEKIIAVTRKKTTLVMGLACSRNSQVHSHPRPSVDSAALRQPLEHTSPHCAALHVTSTLAESDKKESSSKASRSFFHPTRTLSPGSMPLDAQTALPTSTSVVSTTSLGALSSVVVVKNRAMSKKSAALGCDHCSKYGHKTSQSYCQRCSHGNNLLLSPISKLSCDPDTNQTVSERHDCLFNREEPRLKGCIGSTDLLQESKSFSGRFRGFEKARITTRHCKSESAIESRTPQRKKRQPTIENKIFCLEGDHVNYYQVLEEIGRGSFGSVYKCYSGKDQTFYAMKVISKKRLLRKGGFNARSIGGKKSNPLETLQREIAILKKMDHPNVVKLIEVIDDPQIDNVYMVFELMEKGAVIEVPADEGLPEEKARCLFTDLVLGMEYLHYSKVIHRDIKPSNLLLDDSGHIKIADFGVSDIFEGDDDCLSKVAGSPAFQAPETLTFDAGVRGKYSGKAVDIWAMGVTLYCLVYGKCPFYDVDLLRLYELIKSEPVAFPDEPIFDPQLQDLLARMLVKRPEERITMQEIKEHPWVTLAGRQPLPHTEDHCKAIEVSEDEVRNSIKLMTKLSSLLLAKSILKSKSFVGYSKIRLRKRSQIP